MAKYVDGFVLPVPKSKVDEYRKMARKAGKVWREHGALDYKECVSEDVPRGQQATFPRTLGVKRSETVIFAWITFKSRAHRDRVNKKVFEDPRVQEESKTPPPFDMKRMVYGGFEVIVDA
jgi:uncharacterized protein YbaA (DUF1428 family)